MKVKEKLLPETSIKAAAELRQNRDITMAAKHLRKKNEDGGPIVATERYRAVGKAVAERRYAEQGKVAAKRKYESGGRGLAQMKYHILGAKDADVQQHYALTKSSYFKPESLDVEQA